jgi:hypothetical protein
MSLQTEKVLTEFKKTSKLEGEGTIDKKMGLIYRTLNFYLLLHLKHVPCSNLDE